MVPSVVMGIVLKLSSHLLFILVEEITVHSVKKLEHFSLQLRLRARLLASMEEAAHTWMPSVSICNTG
jgi:hypothetical protein